MSKRDEIYQRIARSTVQGIFIITILIVIMLVW